MATSKNLHKVQKQISKKRGGKSNSLHENSRDSQRLRRAGAREDKIAKIAAAASRANQTYVERVAFFKSALKEVTTSMSEDELRTLTTSYIARDDEELAALKAQRRPGRPSSNQEDQLRHRVEAEQKEFQSGFWIPDTRDDEGLKKLRAWNEDWSSLNTLKTILNYFFTVVPRMTTLGIGTAATIPAGKDTYCSCSAFHPEIEGPLKSLVGISLYRLVLHYLNEIPPFHETFPLPSNEGGAFSSLHFQANSELLECRKVPCLCLNTVSTSQLDPVSGINASLRFHHILRRTGGGIDAGYMQSGRPPTQMELLQTLSNLFEPLIIRPCSRRIRFLRPVYRRGVWCMHIYVYPRHPNT